MKKTLSMAFICLFFAFNLSAQKVTPEYTQLLDKAIGNYMKIDSVSRKYEKNGVYYAKIDTTQMILNKDMTFKYKWAPAFGPYSRSHIITTGTWKISNKKITLNSKYQQDEYRHFELYKPEIEANTIKIYVQTYDSLASFFQLQFIGVQKGSSRYSEMIYPDKEYLHNACSATFNISSIDQIVVYGDSWQMPAIKPKNKKANFFLLQYNLSTNWDYQYFKEFPLKLDGEKLILGKKDNKIELRKM